MKEAEAAASEERGLDGGGGGWGIDKGGTNEEKINMSGVGHGEIIDCSAAGVVIYVNIQMFIYIYIQIYACVHISISIYIHKCICIYMYTSMFMYRSIYI